MNPARLFAKLLLVLVAATALGAVFAMYFAPEMMVALSNQFLAMCGW
ncbi:hypothetical protein [Polynucleobacter sinensis]|jgi:hypothetical protein|nr:hypothetical protein [Polynucleobacter sinensis]